VQASVGLVDETGGTFKLGWARSVPVENRRAGNYCLLATELLRRATT
jgi:hypothetical protein